MATQIRKPLSHFLLETNPEIGKHGLFVRSRQGVKTKLSRHTNQEIDKFWINGYDWKYICPGAKSVGDAYSFVSRWPVWAIVQTTDIVSRIRSKWIGLVRRKYTKFRIFKRVDQAKLVHDTKHDLLKKAAIDAKLAIDRLYSLADMVYSEQINTEYVSDPVTQKMYPVHTIEQMIKLAESKPRNARVMNILPDVPKLAIGLGSGSRPAEPVRKKSRRRKKPKKTVWEDAMGYPLPRITEQNRELEVCVPDRLETLTGVIATLKVSPCITYEYTKSAKCHGPDVLRDMLYKMMDRLAYNDNEIQNIVDLLEAKMIQPYEVSLREVVLLLVMHWPKNCAENIMEKIVLNLNNYLGFDITPRLQKEI